MSDINVGDILSFPQYPDRGRAKVTGFIVNDRGEDVIQLEWLDLDMASLKALYQSWRLGII